MRQERQVGQPEQAIFKIDDILVRIQVIARVRVQVREELAGGLRDSPHADKLLIVPGDIAFYGSFEHIHPVGVVEKIFFKYNMSGSLLEKTYIEGIKSNDLTCCYVDGRIKNSKKLRKNLNELITEFLKDYPETNKPMYF